MGNTLYKKLFGHQEVRILFLGLDAAGKTTTLYRLKLGEVVTTIPTIGFNVETVNHKNVNITAWDVGGRDKIRPLYRHYYQNTDGLVFVVDSNDKERLQDAIDELISGIEREDELVSVPVLILANKQDMADAMKPDDIARRIMDAKLLRNHTWTVFGVSALSGDGLFEALTWLTDSMTSVRKHVTYNKLTGNKTDVASKGGRENESDNKGPSKVSYLSDIVLTLKHLIVGK